MANDRQEGDARKPPLSDDPKKQRERGGEAEPKRERQPTNDDLDEGLEETFPASDPPAPSRPTGAK